MKLSGLVAVNRMGQAKWTILYVLVVVLWLEEKVVVVELEEEVLLVMEVEAVLLWNGK